MISEAMIQVANIVGIKLAKKSMFSSQMRKSAESGLDFNGMQSIFAHYLYMKYFFHLTSAKPERVKE